MKVVIAKVDEALFEGDAYSLTVPGSNGEMTVLGHHEPFITTLKAGEVHVRKEPAGAAQTFAIQGGVLEVHGSGATLIL